MADDRQRRVDEALASLMEVFDSVQILATWQENSGETTYDIYRGRGNWYSRTGMAADFLKRDEATTLADKMPKPPPEEGEDWKQD